MKKKSSFFILLLIVGILFTPNIAFALNANCPLGDKVTADLAGALKVFKILAPLFTIVYTLYEGITALVNGNIASESKKLYIRFIKRLVYAVLLFVIPVIVDVLMQAMDIWDATGHCTVGTNSAEVVNTQGESCESKCSHIGDQKGREVCLESCKKSSNTNNGNSVNIVENNVSPTVVTEPIVIN